MPTYDYRCAACGHAIEVFQSISEARKRKCPRCKKPKLERLIGQGAGILFKGGGFYHTDYRSDSYKKSETAEKSASESKADASNASPNTAPTASSEKSAAEKHSSEKRAPQVPHTEKPAAKKTGKRSQSDGRG